MWHRFFPKFNIFTHESKLMSKQGEKPPSKVRNMLLLSLKYPLQVKELKYLQLQVCSWGEKKWQTMSDVCHCWTIEKMGRIHRKGETRFPATYIWNSSQPKHHNLIEPPCHSTVKPLEELIKNSKIYATEGHGLVIYFFSWRAVKRNEFSW